MARITLDPQARGTRPGGLTRALLAITRRTYGQVPDTALAMSHRPPVLRTWGAFEMANARMGSVLPDRLQDLVVFVTGVRIGCSWCVDFGASLWEDQGLDPQVLRDAVTWRESEAFDEASRVAFEYAEAMCADPVGVDDALAARVREQFGEEGLVEITYWVALENMRSRFNSALGLTSQGFSSGDACALVTARAGGTASPAGG